MDRWQLWNALLTDVGRGADRMAEDRVRISGGVRGRDYAGSLMVVGRASRLGEGPYEPREFRDAEVRRHVIKALAEGDEREGCPLRWVAEHWGTEKVSRWRATPVNTRRSPFWRGIRGVQSSLGLPGHDERRWSSHLWFTNIYPVVPSDGDRPSAGLRRSQSRRASELLREEIRRARPLRVLFLTGWDYVAGFLEDFRIDWSGGSTDRIAERAGTFSFGQEKPAAVVVAAHPQGLPDVEWVDQVSTAFRELGRPL